MVGHLEANPDARVVVNFSPILLEQIDDYVQQVQRYKSHKDAIHDPLLAALVEPVLPNDIDSRHTIIRQCLRANKQNVIDRFPAYQRLVEIAGWLEANPDELAYLNQQYVIDLLVWYHLAWFSETERDNLIVKGLTLKASDFSLQDRANIFDVIDNLLRSVISRYQKLAKHGQIELSITPYTHPIMPLLLDLQTARQAIPDLTLPSDVNYADGEERVRWQLNKGIKVFEQHFGFRPQGCWPSEGAVCVDTLRLLQDTGFTWAASGANVLKNSLLRQESFSVDNKTDYLYQPYTVSDQTIKCFFRDDDLSDLIGFTYSDWHSEDAVANLLSELEAIAEQVDTDNAVVSIILDGENAWEYYPHNGAYFLSELYEKLASHSGVCMTTFTDAISQPSTQISELVAGSWVYGTLTTWIGDEQKNRAWQLLIDAKECFDIAITNNSLDEQTLEKCRIQLAICESSDWFWWFGDYNPAEAVSQFDLLYRMHLRHLYMLLDRPAPAYLLDSFGHGSGDPERGGAMRHANG